MTGSNSYIPMIVPNKLVAGEWRITWRDGTVHWIYGRFQTFNDSFTKTPYLLGVNFDSTDRKRLEEERQKTAELAAVNKELESFSYSVSHDLRAPLRTIKSFGQIVLEDYSKVLDSQGIDFLKRIVSGANKMSALIEDILRLSKIASQDILLKPINLSMIATSISEQLRYADPHRIVEVVIAPDLKIKSDESLLEIVLSNLIGNAWKYTSKVNNPRIEVGKLEKNHEVVFYVKDNGAGFEASHAPRLFEAFQRYHSESEFAGTGIGLAIVKKVLDKLGGRIWAESAIGQGSTFYFALSSTNDEITSKAT